MRAVFRSGRPAQLRRSLLQACGRHSAHLRHLRRRTERHQFFDNHALDRALYFRFVRIRGPSPKRRRKDPIQNLFESRQRRIQSMLLDNPSRAFRIENLRNHMLRQNAAEKAAEAVLGVLDM